MNEVMEKDNLQVIKREEAAPVKLTGGNIFSDSQAFALAQRMAHALCSSTIVPKQYQGKDKMGNCLIAVEMAQRLNTSPLMVMQNLYIVNGMPSWSSQYIIAMINSSKKYKTELQFKFEGEGDNLSCAAYVEDWNGHIVTGPTITIQMAKDEGWYNKPGSKWKTMPEVMIRYRAASFFGRLNCPEMIMGLYSADEVIDLEPGEYSMVDNFDNVIATVAAETVENANKEVIGEDVVDKETGEIVGEDEPNPEDAEETEPDF